MEQGDSTVGAMIVCKTNSQARELYRLWQEKYGRMAQIIQLNQHFINDGIAAGYTEHHGLTLDEYEPFVPAPPLTASLILHDEGDKLERKEYIDGFKKLTNVDVLIVNKMLLTGFDAPRLKKLYLGRALDGHDLLQALTRVNRPYKDFKYGYVVDFVNIKENFDATNNRYLHELNRTADDESIPKEERNIADSVLVDNDEVRQKIGTLKSVLFNYTTDNMEEFRQEIDEIEDKDVLYSLRATLTDAKAIINQVRAFGDDEMKDMVRKLPVEGLSTLITEVTHRIGRINLIDDTDTTPDITAIINVVLTELEFEFKKGMPEELRIFVNDLKERCERVQAEFEANFDQNEERYVSLIEEFRKYFREKGFVPKSTQEAKESIEYMDEVMEKIREINRRNNMLKHKYHGDERFVRIHKRIEDANATRQKPLISRREYEIAENLANMKREIDRILFLNIHVLDNEDSFRDDVLAMIGQELRDMKIKSSLDDRKYINNLITTEYLLQRSNA
jgi:type I restriction enzyme R subunit